MNFVSKIRPFSGENKGTFVLMHGLGSDEQDMFGLAQEIDAGYEVVCIRAPHRYGPGYAWFEIEFTSRGVNANLDQLKEAVDCVSELVAGLSGNRVVVGGFSQGAMMTLGMMTWYPNLVDDAVLLSGRALLSGTPPFGGRIFQAHGTEDNVISYPEGLELKALLEPLGEKYEFHSYPMGHWVTPEELSDLNAFLRG